MTHAAQRAPEEPTLDAGTLFRRHAAFVANFLARLGVPRDALDDAVQDVFTVAHRRGGFRPGAAKPTTWLADIAVHLVSNRRRSQRRAVAGGRVQLPDDKVDRFGDGAPSQERNLEHRRSLERVQEALETLDAERRAVFVLYEMHGETCEDIAGGLGIPVGTVYSRLHHARRKFKKAHQRLVARGRPRSPAVTALALAAAQWLLHGIASGPGGAT